LSKDEKVGTNRHKHDIRIISETRNKTRNGLEKLEYKLGPPKGNVYEINFNFYQ